MTEPKGERPAGLWPYFNLENGRLLKVIDKRLAHLSFNSTLDRQVHTGDILERSG